MGRRGHAVLILCLTAIAGGAEAAQATFPGANGRIAVTMGPTPTRIGTVGADGTELTSVTTTWSSVPAWSPDGELLAFFRHDAQTGTSLWLAKADGSEQRQLTRNVSPLVQGPAWSPDGVQIALEHTFQDGALEVVALDGGVVELVPPGGPDLIQGPDWSPDGQTILVTGQNYDLVCNPPTDPNECDLESGPPDLYAVATDGSGIARLTFDGATSSYASPSWSPDGARIAVQRGDGISVLSATGQHLRQIAPQGRLPVWSPDATKIAFAGAIPADRGDVYVVNADGTGRTTLLDGDFDHPDWQPIPNTPPDCSGVRAQPSVLWPPNHKLRTVTLSGSTDPDGDAVTLEVTGVTQDEPAAGEPDFLLTGGDGVQLRAERDPKGDGRMHMVAFRVTDQRGVTCSGEATITVPRHKK